MLVKLNDVYETVLDVDYIVRLNRNIPSPSVCDKNGHCEINNKGISFQVKYSPIPSLDITMRGCSEPYECRVVYKTEEKRDNDLKSLEALLSVKNI